MNAILVQAVKVINAITHTLENVWRQVSLFADNLFNQNQLIYADQNPHSSVFFETEIADQASDIVLVGLSGK